MNLRFSAVAVVVLTLVSTLGQPSPAASAPIPGDHPGVSRVVLTDAEGHRSAAAMAGGPDRASEAISTGVVEVDEFLVAGLTWDAGERLGVGTDIRMRVREDRGWSQWLDVEPDAAADRGARAGTEPFVTGGADAVQVVVTGSSADLPAELELNLISPADEGTSTTWSSATSSAASVAEASPAIVDTPAGVVHTRADWGLTAAEEQFTSAHWVSEFFALQAAVLHHTAGTNSYTSGQSAGVVHSIWVYHAQSLGWGDIGYNFLVDKYGQTFEGRRNSLPQSGDYSVPTDVPATHSVEAGHAYGYNKGTLGISAMGDYTQKTRLADPLLVVEPISQLIAWKFDSAGLSVVDAGSARVLTELISPGTYATYPAGTPLPRIFVHRDVYATACPGSIADAAIINRIYDRVVALGQSAVRIDLTVASHISGKQKYADLSWAGTTASMDVYRNSVVIATTTTGTTSYTDQVAAKVRTATYQVCETKTTNCSDSVTLTW